MAFETSTALILCTTILRVMTLSHNPRNLNANKKVIIRGEQMSAKTIFELWCHNDFTSILIHVTKCVLMTNSSDVLPLIGLVWDTLFYLITVTSHFPSTR